MKILMAHNHYGDKGIGGEMMVLKAERELLEANGFNILSYERSNSELLKENLVEKIGRIKNIHWSKETMENAGKIMDEFKPDILHVHNYKYIISPSIFEAARKRGVKTVLTIHNYRLMVPCGNFMTKNGSVCDKCLDGNYKRVLIKRCVQNSLVKSYLQYKLFTKTKYELNQLNGLVDVFLPLTNFAKNQLIDSGVDPTKIVVKPNFILPINSNITKNITERAVFIGRLSKEKGIIDLIHNWENINYPLYIIGNGPLKDEVVRLSKSNKYIFLKGEMNNDDVLQFLSQSSFLIFPSSWYEGMPLTILEAFSLGIPVLASDIGPRKDLVTDGYDGILYNQKTFADKLNTLISDKTMRAKMAKNALKTYSEKYTPEKNIVLLKKLYEGLKNEV